MTSKENVTVKLIHLDGKDGNDNMSNFQCLSPLLHDKGLNYLLIYNKHLFFLILYLGLFRFI